MFKPLTSIRATPCTDFLQSREWPKSTTHRTNLDEAYSIRASIRRVSTIPNVGRVSSSQRPNTVDQQPPSRSRCDRRQVSASNTASNLTSLGMRREGRYGLGILQDLRHRRTQLSLGERTTKHLDLRLSASVPISRRQEAKRQLTFVNRWSIATTEVESSLYFCHSPSSTDWSFNHVFVGRRNPVTLATRRELTPSRRCIARLRSNPSTRGRP